VSRLRAFLLRIAGLCGLGRSDADIAEELTTHLHMIEVEHRRSGMTEREAARVARVKFGSIASAAGHYRDRRGWPAIDGWFRDVARAARSLRRSPALTVSMVLVLGLGIGLSTALAAAFDRVVWRTLPVPDGDRVVKLTLDFRGAVSREVRGNVHWFSYPELQEYRAAARSMEGLAGVLQERMTWRQDAGSRRLTAELVTGDYFGLLRLTPALGRFLTDPDSRQPVVVIDHRLWMDAFGGAPSTIGRTMVLDGASYTVIGVTDDHFAGTNMDPVDVWLPLEATRAFRGRDDVLTEHNVSWLQAIGRLAPGASLEAAVAEGAVVAARFDEDHPGRRTTVGITRASRLDAGLFQPGERGRLIGAGASGALVAVTLLLICGSNVAALLLARGATRRREVALRVALGAGRGHIAQELVAEVVVIVGAGAALAVVVYAWSLPALASWMPPQIRDLLTTSPLDLRVLGFVAIAALGIALVFGLAPLRQVLRVDCLVGLKGSSSVLGVSMPAAHLRRWLAAGQVAVSVVLLVAAALLGRGLERAFGVNPGYATNNLYVVRTDLDARRDVATAARRWQFMNQTRDALAGTPGVVGASLATLAPFSGAGLSSARTEQMTEPVRVRFNTVGPDYFGTLGIQQVTGRMFVSREANVVLVNASLARKFWGDERAALGRTLQIPGRNPAEAPRSMTVVGVVPTIQTTDVGIPDEPTYYLPVSQDYLFEQATLIVRVIDGASFPRLARQVIGDADGGASTSIVSIADRIALSVEPARVGAMLVGLVGLLALLVAAVGIHGIVAHAVISRTRDIGVYLALGAPRPRVLRLVLGQTMRAVAVGGVVGGVLAGGLAVLFSDQIKTILFGVAPLDPVALLAATGIFLCVTFLAAYVPARRALAIHPSEALRRET
jgi:predicted permease